MSPTKNSQKIANTFRCELCDYTCNKKSDYNKHLTTNKHKILQDPTLNVANIQNYVCNCGKTYKHSSTLYAHKKTCVIINKTVCEPEIYTDTDVEKKLNENFEICDLVKYLMKENCELKMMMMEQQNKMVEQQNKMMEQQNLVLEIAKNGTNNTTTNNTNSHNKAFNLQFFLNETCKDAMNIMDFVESIQLQLSDLEKVGELGYVEGISNIIVKNLKEMDITQRPVHCTDKKRETIYIKDENKWEKDDENNKIRKMIKRVASKNQRLLLKFKELHPDCIKYHSKHSDQYNKLIVESMGGSGNNDLEKEDKIIRNITKVTTIDKSL
jgi:hypothetical protein